MPFQRQRSELVAAGRVQPHRGVPDSGWVSFRIRGPEDAPAVVARFRMQDERLVARRQAAQARRKASTEGSPEEIGGNDER